MTARTVCKTVMAMTAALAIGTSAGAASDDDTRSRLGIGPIEIIPSLKSQLQREGKTTIVGRIQEAMAPQLEDRLLNSRKFRVFARDDLGKILEEEDLAPLLDPATAPETLRLSGIEYLVVVTIDHFEDRMQTLRLEHARRELTRRFVEIGAVAKLWNTETGELLETANWEIGSDDEDLELPQDLRRAIEDADIAGEGEVLNRLLRRMGATLAQRISNRVVDVIYPAMVSGVSGKRVFINRGDGTDIKPGEVWTVYALGDEMHDPATGRSLGRIEEQINTVRIIRVETEFSVGEIIEDQDDGVAVGHILRRQDKAGTR